MRLGVTEQAPEPVDKMKLSAAVRSMFENVRVPTPVFVKVIVLTPLFVPCGRVPKLIEVADELATGALVAVPDNATLCLLAESLSELSDKVKFAARIPVAPGMNATVTLQRALAARVPGQLLAC